MGMRPADLMRAQAWSAVVMGNHAVARAMVEARVQVAATYPGSPTPEIAAALDAVAADERPYHFEYATNEKVAVELAAGAALNGHLAAVFFKSVGLNVASDSLIQLPMMELIGGLVVILGDDPGANSSQNEQDNRHFARMAYLPMLEPASPREAYAMFLDAAAMARRHKTAVLLRMTTHVSHAREKVDFAQRDTHPPDWTPRFDRRNGPYVPIADTVFPLKRKALLKLDRIAEEFASSPHNVVVTPHGHETVSGTRRGVVASGLPALAVLENLTEAGHPVALLKLGCTHPLPVEPVRAFLEANDEVLIIEELDRVLEQEIKALAWDRGLRCRILARSGIEERMGELDTHRTWSLLARSWPDLFTPRDDPFAAEREAAEVVARWPQLCPGCGHRSAFHAVRRALRDRDITVADIGCHSVGFWPPHEMGEVLLSMGHAPATAAGLALGNDQRKVVAFLGDSTLMHAGLPAIVNAVVNGHNVTLVLLENGTTAMTGHQPRPGAGEVGDRIPLPEMLAGLGVKFVRDVDAYQQEKLIGYVREALDFDGFAVVIARHPCMLKFMREQRRRRPDLSINQVRIDPEACTLARVCIAGFGCPSFVADGEDRVMVHEDLCIGDGSCLQTCPVQAIGRPKRGSAS